MIRECSEQGKKILYRNRHNICDGIFSVKARSNSVKYVWMFLIGFIMSGVMYEFFSRIIPPRYLSAVVRIGCIISFGFFGLIAAAIYEVVYTSKQKKKFFKSDSIYVNGATIVKVDHEKERILYVEDDVFDRNRTPILLAYPFEKTEAKNFAQGERVMMLYDTDENYHMMKSNERMNQIFQISNRECVSIEDLMSKAPIPHLNALYIDEEERALSYGEKEKLSKNFAKAESNGNMVFAVLIGALLIYVTMFWAVIYGRDEGVLQKAIIVGLIICVGICFCVYIFYWIMRLSYRKKYNFTHVKETVIHSIEYKSSSYVAIVYEWVVNNLELKEYENIKCMFPVKYGSVCYRLRISENEFIFYPKDELMK